MESATDPLGRDRPQGGFGTRLTVLRSTRHPRWGAVWAFVLEVWTLGPPLDLPAGVAVAARCWLLLAQNGSPHPTLPR